MKHDDGAVDIDGGRCIYVVEQWKGMVSLVESTQVWGRLHYINHDLGAEGLYRSRGHTKVG